MTQTYCFKGPEQMNESEQERNHVAIHFQNGSTVNECLPRRNL